MRAAALVLAISATLLAAALVVGPMHGLPASAFYRDPVAVMEVAFAVGWFSQFGAMVWLVTGGILLFTAGMVGGAERRSLFHLGTLTMLLGLDDLFLIHDGLFKMAGVPGTVLHAVYVGMIAAWLSLCAPVIERTRWTLLAAAVACLLLSQLVDVVHDAGGSGSEAGYLAEDVAKLAGILFWGLYGLGYARQVASAVVNRPITNIAPPRIGA